MNKRTSYHTNVKLNAHTILVVIALIIGTFITGYLAYFFIASTRPAVTTSTREVSKPARIRASMYLSMDATQGTVNQPFMVDVMLDAKGAIINGADGILLFDPKKVRVDKVTTDTTTTFLYFPKVDKQKGRVVITAIKQTTDSTPTTVVKLATITFTPIAKGTTTITFEHFPGRTNGSTAIQAKDNTNILDAVTGMTITTP